MTAPAGAASIHLPAPALPDGDFCRAMLPRVSRTFALCIRLLPPGLAHPVMVAYLLCRIADTIEDSAVLEVGEKRDLLHRFASTVGTDTEGGDWTRGVFPAAASDEEYLVREAERVLREYRALAVAEQSAIRPWVQEMCTGMAEFARPSRAPAEVQTLATVDDLDRYCYFVAGTVGHLLTGLFRLHAGRIDPARFDRLDHLATSFGLGLQLTNIIKDAAHDHRQGWSFVPGELCRRAGVAPADLFDARHRSEARAVMDTLIDKASTHLDDALEYTLLLPRRLYRVRLFCLTALYFAVRTLHLARRDARLLDPAYRLKITRGEVYRIVATAAAVAPSNVLTRACYTRLGAADLL